MCGSCSCKSGGLSVCRFTASYTRVRGHLNDVVCPIARVISTAMSRRCPRIDVASCNWVHYQARREDVQHSRCTTYQKQTLGLQKPCSSIAFGAFNMAFKSATCSNFPRASNIKLQKIPSAHDLQLARCLQRRRLRQSASPMAQERAPSSSTSSLKLMTSFSRSSTHLWAALCTDLNA